MILQSAVSRWASQQPKTIACLNKLHVSGVRLAVFSSRLAHLAAEAKGIKPDFSPNDTDLIMPPEDFDKAVNILKLKPLIKTLRVKTSDGLTLRMTVKEVRYISDSLIHLLQPLQPLRGGRSVYHTAFSANAVEARQFYETEHGIIPLAHFSDAMYFYGILQRSGAGKDDLRNLALLKTVFRRDDAYSKLRAAEMNIDSRVIDFIQRASQVLYANTKPAR